MTAVERKKAARIKRKRLM